MVRDRRFGDSGAEHTMGMQAECTHRACFGQCHAAQRLKRAAIAAAECRRSLLLRSADTAEWLSSHAHVVWRMRARRRIGDAGFCSTRRGIHAGTAGRQALPRWELHDAAWQFAALRCAAAAARSRAFILPRLLCAHVAAGRRYDFVCKMRMQYLNAEIDCRRRVDCAKRTDTLQRSPRLHSWTPPV